jgi:hypothetical protein
VLLLLLPELTQVWQLQLASAASLCQVVQR